MKKIFTLLTATIFSFSLFALAPQTKLTVSTDGKKAVMVMVDGKTYTDRKDDDKTEIENLAVGSHNIKVYQQNNNGFFNKKMQLLYDGDVYVRTRSNTKVAIDRMGRATVTTDRIDNFDYPSNNENGGWNARYPQAMNDRGFDQLRATVNRTSFENPKMDVAKEAISRNYFTTDQIQTLLGSFNYESSKVEIAKYAYERTLDKENYYVVANAFNYSSSKQELMKFLQRR